MNELRLTDTNSADDSAGRAFGLEGNLYLVLVIALMGALGVAGLLGFVLRVSWVFAVVAGVAPLTGVAGWVICLKHGKPAGYDRDRIETAFGGGDFTRSPADQEGLV
ncbi:MAG: hypothetical protein WC378_03915 [Opitutaceae bacterium]|jgi:hypothetical protein